MTAHPFAPIVAAGILLTAGFTAIAVAAAISTTRWRRVRRARREQARRRQLVNQAAVWHGYPPPTPPAPPAPKLARLHLDYALDETPIPPGLHAQHVLAGAERQEGRLRR